MGGEIAAGVVGGRQHLHPEAVEEGPRPVLGECEALHEAVVDEVRVGGGRADGNVEHLDQRRFEPVAGGGASEGVPPLTQPSPGLAGVGHAALSAAPRDAQLGEGHAVGVEHAGHVVIRSDEQRRRIVEGAVLLEEDRVHVPVRRDDRQAPHRLVEPPGHLAPGRFRREQAIRVEIDPGHRSSSLGGGGPASYRWIRAAPPAATARTWARVAIVVSPGYPVTRAPCAHPRRSACSGGSPASSP